MNLDDLDAGALMQYLSGVDFPAEKEQVASTAEGNDAPQEMVWRIRNARTRRYDHPDNVLEAVQGRRVFWEILGGQRLDVCQALVSGSS